MRIGHLKLVFLRRSTIFRLKMLVLTKIWPRLRKEHSSTWMVFWKTPSRPIHPQTVSIPLPLSFLMIFNPQEKFLSPQPKIWSHLLWQAEEQTSWGFKRASDCSKSTVYLTIRHKTKTSTRWPGSPTQGTSQTTRIHLIAIHIQEEAGTQVI